MMRWRPKWWIKIREDIDRIEQAALRIEQAADSARKRPARLRRVIRSWPPSPAPKPNGGRAIVIGRKGEVS